METYWRWVLVILWHTLPIWTVMSGRVYATIAMVGLVALPYIKVRKLEQNALNIESTATMSVAPDAEVAALRLAADRWRRLTWPRSRSSRGQSPPVSR